MAEATCLGGIALARVLTDPQLRDATLAACRNAVLRELGHTS